MCRQGVVNGENGRLFPAAIWLSMSSFIFNKFLWEELGKEME